MCSFPRGFLQLLMSFGPLCDTDSYVCVHAVFVFVSVHYGYNKKTDLLLAIWFTPSRKACVSAAPPVIQTGTKDHSPDFSPFPFVLSLNRVTSFVLSPFNCSPFSLFFPVCIIFFYYSSSSCILTLQNVFCFCFVLFRFFAVTRECKSGRLYNTHTHTLIRKRSTQWMWSVTVNTHMGHASVSTL